MVVLGMVEFGRLIMVQQVLTNATRVGARRAVIEGTTESEVQALVENYLSQASISGATVTVDPGNLDGLGFGESVTVEATVPYNSVSWTGSPWFLDGKTLRAKTMMQVERLQ